jgi:hypothetical protein
MTTYSEIHEKLISEGAEHFQASLNEIQLLHDISIKHFEDKYENVEQEYGTGIFELDPNDERKPDEIIADIVDQHRYLFDSQFKKILTESLFVMAYSVFEKHLNSICQNSWLELKSKIKLTDLHGKGIFRAFFYFEKVVGISIDTESEIYNNIKCYNKIRNIIVHSGGSLKNTDPELDIYIRNSHSLFVSKSNRLEIIYPFLRQVLDDLSIFMVDIYNKLQKHYGTKDQENI